MIDRVRLEELRRKGKSPTRKLEEFLAESQLLIFYMAKIVVEVERERDSSFDPFDLLVECCIVEKRVGLPNLDVAYIRKFVVEFYEHLVMHERISEMRLKTRGCPSDDRLRLEHRLSEVRQVFERFAALSPLFWEELRDRPHRNKKPRDLTKSPKLRDPL